jgi:hypothetical protein
MTSLAVMLYNSTHCEVDFRAIDNFYVGASTCRGVTIGLGSRYNTIRVHRFKNANDETGLIEGIVDACVEINASFDNVIEFGELDVYPIGTSVYVVIKIENSGNNKIRSLKNFQIDTARNNIYSYITTPSVANGWFYNYIESPNVIDTSFYRKELLPVQLYSNSLDDTSVINTKLWSAYKINYELGVLESSLAANTLLSYSDVDTVRSFGQLEAGLTEINFCVGGAEKLSQLQRIFLKNVSNHSYVQIFGNGSGSDDVSDLTNENLSFTKYNTSNQKL